MAGRNEKFSKKQEMNPADVSNINVTRGELDPTRRATRSIGQLFPNKRNLTQEELYQMISNMQQLKPRLKGPKGQIGPSGSMNRSTATMAKEPARNSGRRNPNLPMDRTAGGRVVNTPEVKKEDPEGGEDLEEDLEKFIGARKGQVSEICDEKFVMRVQKFREEFRDEVLAKQAEQEETMQSILMATAQLRSDMDSMPEDRAAIKNLASMMEALLSLGKQGSAKASSMKSDIADGKRRLQSNEKIGDVPENPSEWRNSRNSRNRRKTRGRNGRKNTFASEERYASGRNHQPRRRRSPSPKSYGSRSP